MKVLYDYQAFQMQRFGGISRYFAEIIDHLPDDVLSEIAIQYSDNEYLMKKKLTSGIKSLYDPGKILFHGLRLPGRRTILNYLQRLHVQTYQEPAALNKQLTIARLKAQDFDVFHPTYYDDYFLEFIGQKPFVLTIHDMIHEIYPEFYPMDTITSKVKRKLAILANHIIAVSENTKKDIISFYDINPDKISVIYHSSAIAESKMKFRKLLPKRYILYVGERVRYKNFKFFMNGIYSLLNEDSSLSVVCVGSGFNEDEKLFFKSLRIDAQVYNFQVEDDEMFDLYNQALFFVFPSYYEGFGIPILEAFEAECPVILSRASCFMEIAGDAALYFSPKDVRALKAVAGYLLANIECRQSLIDKANIRKRSFLWSKSAEQTYEVYKRVVTK